MKDEKRPQGALSTAGEASHIVAPPADSAHLLRWPAAYATAFGPTGRRRRWAATVRCPICSGGHLLFAAELDRLAGVKTTTCGRLWVVVARVVVAVEAVADAA